MFIGSLSSLSDRNGGGQAAFGKKQNMSFEARHPGLADSFDSAGGRNPLWNLPPAFFDYCTCFFPMGAERPDQPTTAVTQFLCIGPPNCGCTCPGDEWVV